MQKINLFNSNNYFTFCPCDEKRRPCVVIAPGGGYDHTSKLEAFNVSKKFNDNGYHACVLNYREDLMCYPQPQKDLAFTIDWLRKNDLIIPNQIISIGFSAGGHLTLSNACFYKEYGYDSRPNYLILCYPVISSNEKYAHLGSFKALLGDNYNEEMLEKLSLEKNIPDDLGDVFLWHNYTDESVPVQNSLVLLEALKEKNINCECHLFPMGCHGMSLSDETTGINDSRKNNPYVAKWFDMVIDWLNYKIKF